MRYEFITHLFLSPTSIPLILPIQLPPFPPLLFSPSDSSPSCYKPSLNGSWNFLSLGHKITNVPVVYVGLDIWIWMGGNPFFGAVEGVGPEILTFWAQMALSTLVPILGTKKVTISGPTPSNSYSLNLSIIPLQEAYSRFQIAASD